MAELQPLVADYDAFAEQVRNERASGAGVGRKVEERLDEKRRRAEEKRAEMDEVTPPGLFVFCGNFRSRPFLFNGEAVREYQGQSDSDGISVGRVAVAASFPVPLAVGC